MTQLTYETLNKRLCELQRCLEQKLAKGISAKDSGCGELTNIEEIIELLGLQNKANVDASNIERDHTRVWLNKIGAEPAFTKNTGFNKNFGTAPDTVSEGNHTHPEFDELRKLIGAGSGNTLTDEEYEKLKNLFYKIHTAVFNVAPASGEKGVATTVTFSYNITPNDDTVTSVNIPDASNLQPTSGTAVFNNVVDTLAKTLTVNYRENGETIKNKTYNKSYVAYVPQWGGKSSLQDINSYDVADEQLTKKIQASSAYDIIIQPANEYVYFLNTNGNARIFDQNNFEQTIGDWGNNSTEFYKKQIIISLKDGTSQVMYLYRTRLTKTIPNNFKYQIK